MPSSSAVIEAQLDKLELNMGRFDQITNADDTTDIAVDSGTVPSVRKLFKEIQDLADAAIGIVGSSASVVSIGEGTKVFTTQSGKPWIAGAFMFVSSAADPEGRWMFGQIISYSANQLILDVQLASGTGTAADWAITLSGAQGAVPKLYAPFTPYDLAPDPTAIGVGDSVADTLAIQTYLNYISAFDVGISDWSGPWKIDEGMIYGHPAKTVTIGVGNPGIVHLVDHRLPEGARVTLTTTGALPTGLVPSTPYYAKPIDDDNFALSLVAGGADIITSGIQSGVHTATFASGSTKQIIGEFKLSPTGAMDYAFLITSLSHVHLSDIRIVGNVSGSGSGAWGLRQVGNGVVIHSCPRLEIAIVYADYLQGFAVSQVASVPVNSNTVTVGTIKASHCGSGVKYNGYTNNLVTPFTTYSHPTTTDNILQRSRVTGVTQFPPDCILEASAYGAQIPGSTHLMAYIGNKLYIVMAVDKTAGTVDVHPRIAPYNNNITMTLATPTVITWNQHGLVDGAPVKFTTTGDFYTGVDAGVTYYVSVIDANTFNISLTYNYTTGTPGALVATSGGQSGTHSIQVNFDWVFGGALNVAGSDSNNFAVKRIDSVFCGIGLSDAALYGVNCGEIQAQGTGVIWSFGIPLNSSSEGGNVMSIYAESDCLHEVVQTSSATVANNFHFLSNHKTILNLTKWRNLSSSLKNADALPVLSLKGLEGLMFHRNNRWQFYENRPDNASETSSAVVADMGDINPNFWRFNTKNVNIVAAPAGLNAVTGRQGKVIFIEGTGANEQPTGTITVFPPAGGATVNGGASAAFSGFSGPIALKIYHSVAANDYRVGVIGSRSVAGVAAWTGTKSNATRATYTSGAPGAAYSEPWADGIDAAVVNVSQGLGAVIDVLRSLGIMT